jgi:MATE family, multidrug efflux pump
MPTDAPNQISRFASGSTLRHVVVMAGTGAIGLVAVFVIDLVNLFYVSRLGDSAIAAAIGFAGAVSFLQSSVALGLVIGLGVVVSRAIGAGRIEEARSLSASGLVLMIALTMVIGAATLVSLDPLLDALGATGQTRRLAAQFLNITAPSLPLLGLGMGCSALLRSVGDARRAMNNTLYGALTTGVMDPVLIFGAQLDLAGAAISTVLSRLVLAAIGWHGATRRHALIGSIRHAGFISEAHKLLGIALPAILTNLATPLGAAYVTRSMAQFGPSAVAGQATIDRITPVAFGLVYALSGAVGPIIAQNLGAMRMDRVRAVLRDSFAFVLIAVSAAWLALAVTAPVIVQAFSVSGQAAALVRLFCSLLAGGYIFVGWLFVANTAFNNLGYPLLSTVFNWARVTLGTIPFVQIGEAFGPNGVLIGQSAGTILIGHIATIVALRILPRQVAERPGHTLSVAPGTGMVALAALASRPLRLWEHRERAGLGPY